MKLEQKGWATCGICGSEWQTNYWVVMGRKKLPTICSFCDEKQAWKVAKYDRPQKPQRTVRSPVAD